MPDLRISVGLPQLIHDGDPDVVQRYAVRAEELGFAGLWSLDSVPGGATARAPLLDGLHVLTTAAAVTRAIGLGIAVIVLPARNAALLAKELATIDRLSGGRLIVGVGVGRREPTESGLGLPAGRRARRLEEGLEVMRTLWAGDEAAYEGEIYRFADVTLEPKPIQHGGPPVWFGAASPPALRRAARMGDGWLGAGSSPSAAFPDQVRLLTDALREAGRDSDAFPIGKRVYIAVEDTEPRALERLSPVLDGMYGAPGLTKRVAVCGPPEACAAQLRDLAAAGARELLLCPMYAYHEQLEALADVAPRVRDG
jgi:probable F420-dependent oxidoreductase